MAQIWSTSIKANTADSGPGGNDQTQPSIVRLGDGFLAVWADNSFASGALLKAQKFGFLGQKLGGEFIVSNSFNPSSGGASLSALPDGGFVVAYRHGLNGNIDLAWFNSNGTKVDEVAIPQIGRNPSVAGLSNGNVYVTWDSPVTGVVTGQLYSPNGNLIDTTQISNAEDLERNGDSAAFGNGQTVVLYTRDDLDEATPGVDGTRYIGFRVINADGSLGLSRRIASDDLAELSFDSAQITRVPGVGFAMAWSMKGEFTNLSARVRLYDTSGNKLNPGLDGKAWGAIGNDNIVEDIVGYGQSDDTGSGFTMVYRNAETDELFGQDFDGAGNTAGSFYKIADNVQDAALAMTADGRIAVSITRTVGGNADIRTFMLDPREVLIVGTEDADVLTSRPIGGAVVEGRGGDDLLYGDDSADVLKGGDGDDLLLGNAGNDVLRGGRGEDSLSGGTGTDTADYSDLDRNDGKPNGFGTTFNVDLDDGIAVLTHRLGDAVIKIQDQLNSIENVIGSAGDDEIYGDEKDNSLSGGDGNDTLWGGIGGSDTLIGGNGNDRYAVDDVGDIVTENGTGADSIYLDNIIVYSLASRPSIEALYYSVSIAGVAVHLTGNGKANLIAAGKFFRATESNSSGNDLLDGGGGNDVLKGGLGDDIYRVDTSLDFVDEAGDPLEEGEDVGGIDTVESKATAFSLDVRTAGEIENLIYTGSGNFSGAGNALANELTGGNGTDLLKGRGGGDTLKGLGGNDTLEGEDGNDILNGGAGGDVLDGGAGNDAASYAGATAGVVANLSNPAGNTGNAAGDSYISIENLAGSAFDDNLLGDNGANRIAGGVGNDTFRGYRGNDVLFGHAGNDIFIFNTALNAATNVDQIMDFAVIGDTIWLGSAIFTTLGAVGALAASAFAANATGAAGDASDRVIFETDTGKLFYDADGTGAAAAVQFATLTSGLALTAADFVIV